MSFRLQFLGEARVEIEDAVRYYEECVPGLGVRLRTEMERICIIASRQPEVWRERPGGYRRANLRGFPYYIAFFLRDEAILIAAVAHASRHPDYWKKRVR